MKLITLTNGQAEILVEVGSKGHEKATGNGYEAKAPTKEPKEPKEPKAGKEPKASKEPKEQKSAEPPDFAAMSAAELKAVAAEFKIELGEAKTKEEILPILQAEIAKVA